MNRQLISAPQTHSFPSRRALTAAARLDWRSLAAFGLPLLLYLRTLAPTIYGLDSAELTTAAATGGLVRATGYPLYLLLGGLWAQLPAGDVGFRLNLFSAVCGASTLALAERILRRLGVGPLAAFGALALLAVAPFFWALSVVAEVYTLHTALMAGLILQLLRWRERPTALRLGLAGLLGGLGLSHHMSMALLLPGCALFVLLAAPRAAFAPRALLATLAGAAFGLSLYLALPLRAAAAPAFNYAGVYDAAARFHPADLSDPAQLIGLVTGRQFAGQMLGYDRQGWLGEAGRFGRQLMQSFFAVGLGPGLLGVALLLRRDRALGAALLLMFALSAGFYIGYRVVDKDTMFLPVYLIWALWVGLGYQRLLAWLGPGRESWSLGALIVVLAACALCWNWPLVDRSNDWSARQRGEAVLASLAPGALVLGYWETAPIVEYLQLVEGRRPDVQVINRFLIGEEAMLALIEREASRRPIYIDTPNSAIIGALRVAPAGPIFRLLPRSAIYQEVYP
jgi:hypothetical protein